MGQDIIAGIDLGGTAIKGVACRPDGTVVSRDTAATPDDQNRSGGAPPFAEAVKDLTGSIAPGSALIGISTPGLVAPDGFRVSSMPGRLAGLEGFDWSGFLGQSVYLINDAQSALLAETWTGSARNCANVLLLTLGTGVGGAAIVDGRLLNGAIGRAGHVGHTTVDYDGSPDICRTPGSLEDAIGNHNIEQRSDGKFQSTAELLEALAAGDAVAGDVWNRSVRSLAAGLVSLVNVLDPEKVVIGGGISRAGAALFEPLARELDRMEWRPGGHRVKIVPAEHDQWAGAIGAAKNALDGGKPYPDESSRT